MVDGQDGQGGGAPPPGAGGAVDWNDPDTIAEVAAAAEALTAALEVAIAKLPSDAAAHPGCGGMTVPAAPSESDLVTSDA